jgi:RND family efflux transporter MFP subunit
MFRKYLVPLLALIGLLVAVFAVIHGDRPPVLAPPVSEAPQSPYPVSVAGSGIVEASTQNISIGTPVAGIVSEVFVQAGSNVKAGDPLFALDDRAVRAELAVRRAAEQVAEAQLADAKHEFDLTESLSGLGIATKGDRERKRFAVQKAEAQVALAQSELESGETALEQLTVRAPLDGQVLQREVQPGEFAPTAGASPLILLGGITPLHVRVDVNENDAWRVRADAAALGTLRGNRKIGTALKFVRFEPYVVPKHSLTGDNTERVDTRVLQIIFSFERGDLPIFIGQQMDVFIDATDPTQKSDRTPAEH